MYWRPTNYYLPHVLYEGVCIVFCLWYLKSDEYYELLGNQTTRHKLLIKRTTCPQKIKFHLTQTLTASFFPVNLNTTIVSKTGILSLCLVIYKSKENWQKHVMKRPYTNMNMITENNVETASTWKKYVGDIFSNNHIL